MHYFPAAVPIAATQMFQLLLQCCFQHDRPLYVISPLPAGVLSKEQYPARDVDLQSSMAPIDAPQS